MSKKNKNRAAAAKAPEPVQQPPSLSLVETPASTALKLDLGCGQNPKEGFEGVDLYSDKAKHKVDLFKFPWPFADESVDEISTAHFLEHVPAREIDVRDLAVLSPAEVARLGTNYQTINGAPTPMGAQRFFGQDMLFAFIDECYRILKPDCWMHIIVPSGRSNRAFWDPTHRRFFMQETFLYFCREWRQINKLDHYRIKANFGVDVGHTLPQEEGLKSAEAQATRFLHYWNVTVDWVAKMKKLPL